MTYSASASSAQALAGQAIAVRVTGDPDPANNGLFYLHNDHASTLLSTGLGSVSAMSDVNGNLVPDSTARYTPFGGWRTEPGTNPEITDRGYTGHKSNNSGDNDLGLIYMNARYYVPYIYRMVSPDTIVPNPTNPQSLNRYSYVRNNSVRYTDPSGHYVADTNDGSIDEDIIIESYYESELETPLQLPIIASNKVVGREYWMPANSKQTTVNENSLRYKTGRVLAGAGIAIDVVELVLSTVPGAGIGPAWLDSSVTHVSGVLTGDNYAWGLSPSPEGLPAMLSFNQDTAVNVVEAAGPPAVALAVGAAGFGSGALTPIPGDELVLGGSGILAVQIFDAVTSAASASYDYLRYTEAIENPWSVGYSFDYGIIRVNW